MLQVVDSLRRGLFDPERDFEAYVRGIARHVVSHAAAGGQTPLPLAETVPDDVRDKETSAVEARMLAEFVLDAVSPACRQLLIGYFIEERSYDDIAADQGVPVGTIKSRIFRCLEYAAQCVRPAGVPHARKTAAPGRFDARVGTKRANRPTVGQNEGDDA